MITRSSIREAIRAVTPRRAADYYRFMRLARDAGALERATPPGADPARCCEQLWRSPHYRPLQKQTEITRLVEMVGRLRPSTVCEIGAAGGGTLFLFTRVAAPDATLVTIDVEFDPARRAALRRFARRGQRVVCLEGDSHGPETLRALRASLGGRPLDVLFIDGDHTYEGVAADFRLYSPLVRRGGLIAFHDIVPDHGARFGADTLAHAGGVPQFWSELKSGHAAAEEIVECREQDGYGIGVIFWEGQGGAAA